MLEEIFDTLRGIVRRLSGRAESPSLGIIDSRSVRTSHHIDGQRGIDGNKKIKGRKEHIVVDTLGLPMSVRVHPANVHDSVGAEEVFESMRYKFPGLKRILADGQICPHAKKMDCRAHFLMARELQETDH